MDPEGTTGRLEKRQDGRWKETKTKMTSNEHVQTVVEIMMKTGGAQNGVAMTLTYCHLYNEINTRYIKFFSSKFENYSTECNIT